METTLEKPSAAVNAERKADSPAMSGSESVERPCLYEVHAREKAGMPPEWELYSYKCMPPGGPETHYMELTGAVVPKVTKGKRAGKPNYAKRDKTTVRVVYITPKEHDDWMAAWEKKTGMCSRCTGTGEILQSISVTDGAKYRECPKCKGARTPNELLWL